MENFFGLQSSAASHPYFLISTSFLRIQVTSSALKMIENDAWALSTGGFLIFEEIKLVSHNYWILVETYD